MTACLRAPFISVCLILFASTANAQSRAAAADVTGVVLDPSGAVVARAAVTAVAAETGLVWTTASDADGRFVLAALPVGPYRLRVERTGFDPVTRHDIVLQLGATADLTVTLPIASVQQRVDVSAETPLVDLRGAAQTMVVTATQIEKLPTNGRNFVAFSLLTPGVFEDRVPNQGGARTSGLSFNGQTARANNVMVDGVDNNDEVFGGVRATFSQEAVREFQVLTTAYSAEFGKASGGVINIVTKSGTNQVAGSAFEFFRDQALNSRGYFEQFDSAGAPVDRPKAPFSQNQFGGTFGAPIRRDRSFVFASFERRVTQASNFVAIDDQTPVPDPVVPGRVLGTPAGILRAAGFAFDTGNVPFDLRANQALVRVDHRVNPRHLLTGRFNIATEWNENIEPFGGLVAKSRAAQLDATDVIGALSMTSIVSGGGVNELRVQVARRDQETFALDPRCDALCDREDEGGPAVDVTGVASVGRHRFTPNPRDNVRFQGVDTVSVFRGRHQFRAGVDFSFVHGVRQALPLAFGGRFVFVPLTLPIGPGGSPAPVSSIQAVALGVPVAYAQGWGYSGRAYDYKELALFAQDEWRPSPRLTLHFGVRYQTQFWPEITYTSVAGYPGEYSLPSDRNDVAPRLGVVWAPDEGHRTSIRGAYGLFYANLITAEPPATRWINGTDGVHTAVITPPLSFAAWNAPEHRLPIDQIVRGGYPSLAFTMDPALRTPYAHHASAGVARDLGRGVLVAVDFAYVRGFNQSGALDYNPVVPSLGPGRRPADVGGVPGTSTSMVQFTSYGRSWYQGLTASASKRFNGRVQFQASYTLSKAEDTITDFTTDFLPQTTGRGRDPNDLNGLPIGFDPLADKGSAIGDQRHRLVLSGVFVAPGAIELSGVVNVGSGRPYNILAGVDLNGDGDAGAFPTDRARTSPADPQSSLERNAGRLPATATVDLRVARAFPLQKSRRATVMIELFNLFNRTNFVGIQNVFGAGGYPSTPLPTYGQFTQAAAPRQVQLGVRFLF